jgi:hypothetical protein
VLAAAGEPGAPPELLAAAFISVLTNEPAEVGATSPPGRCAPEDAPPHQGCRLVRVHDVVLAGDDLLLGRSGTQVRPLLDVSIAQASDRRQQRLAIGLATRGWLALRRGDLIAAEEMPGRSSRPTSAPTLYRV